MQLTATIEVRIQVDEDDNFQHRVAAELRKHAEYLETQRVGKQGAEGTVSWNAVLSPDGE